MKVDQDTLERRLWAKMEKVKGDHEKGTRTDREMYVRVSHKASLRANNNWNESLMIRASITGTPISPTKKKVIHIPLALTDEDWLMRRNGTESSNQPCKNSTEIPVSHLLMV